MPVIEGAGSAGNPAAPVLTVQGISGGTAIPITGGSAGGTSMVDRAAVTLGTDSLTPIGGVFDDTPPTALASGTVGIVRLTGQRAMHVSLRAADGASAMDETNDAVRVNVVAGSSGGVAHTDDAAFTPAVDDGVPIFGVFDDTTPDSVDEGDAGAVRMSANRNLYVQLRDAAGNERGANVDANGGIGVHDQGGSLTVDGLVTVSGINNALPAGDNNIGNVDVVTMPTVTVSATDLDIRALSSVGDSVAAVQSGTWNIGTVTTVTTVSAVTAITNALPAGANNIGDVDVLTLPAGTVAGSASLPAGTNNIGDVDILSIAAGDNNIGNVDVASIAAGDNNIGNVDLASALPAGTNLLGSIAAAPATDVVYQGTTARTPVFAAIDAATSGDNTLVAAQGAGNKIRVHSLWLVSSGTVTVRFESGAGGTALSGQASLVANTGFVLPFSPVGHFETAANAVLNLELSAAVSVDGGLVYSVVT